MKISQDKLIFESTGKEFYSNNNIIGICPELYVTQGYDGGVPHEEFTQSEREELAEYMIKLWNEFKETP